MDHQPARVAMEGEIRRSRPPLPASPPLHLSNMHGAALCGLRSECRSRLSLLLTASAGRRDTGRERLLSRNTSMNESTALQLPLFLSPSTPGKEKVPGSHHNFFLYRSAPFFFFTFLPSFFFSQPNKDLLPFGNRRRHGHGSSNTAGTRPPSSNRCYPLWRHAHPQREREPTLISPSVVEACRGM